MPRLVSIEEIRAAAAGLDGVALRTPLVPFPRIEPRLLLKAESLQPTGSFKLRGAYTAISALPAEARRRGIVAHSSGNHAAAVAYAAALLGVAATVVIPANAPPVKIAAARAAGAKVVISQPGLSARITATTDLIKRYGYTIIPPFDDRMVIAGQGTVGLEIATDCPAADLVLCPVSGGGLISGVAAAIKALNPDAKIIGVEPELAADARDSLRQRQRVAWPSTATQRTIADALRVEQVGELPLQHMLSYVHDVVTVSDDEIRAAMRRLALEARLVAEPGGAAAVAACLFREHELPAASVRVAVLSGGNADPALLAEILGTPASEPEAGQPEAGEPGWARAAGSE